MARKKRKALAEINVVPYIDVMLVLLEIFMVTAPLLLQGVKVELPQAPSQPLDKKDLEPLIVSIKHDGALFLNTGQEQKQAKPLNTIIDTIAKVMRNQPETPILVWGDKQVAYGKVVALMTELQNAGAESVGLVTEP